MLGKSFFSFLPKGAVLSLFITLTPAARAALIVDDLGDAIKGATSAGSNPYKAQGFSSDASGIISSVTLNLSFNQAAVNAGAVLDVYLYTATSTGQPSESLILATLLGTITASTTGAQLYTLTPAASDTIIAGQNYAIVLNTAMSAGAVGWEYSSSGSGSTGSGAFLTAYNGANGSAGWSSVSQQRNLAVEVVPEPITRALMIFGAGGLAISLARWRRRNQTNPFNFRQAVPPAPEENQKSYSFGKFEKAKS